MLLTISQFVEAGQARPLSKKKAVPYYYNIWYARNVQKSEARFSIRGSSTQVTPLESPGLFVVTKELGGVWVQSMVERSFTHHCLHVVNFAFFITLQACWHASKPPQLKRLPTNKVLRSLSHFIGTKIQQLASWRHLCTCTVLWRC